MSAVNHQYCHCHRVEGKCTSVSGERLQDIYEKEQEDVRIGSWDTVPDTVQHSASTADETVLTKADTVVEYGDGRVGTA